MIQSAPQQTAAGLQTRTVTDGPATGSWQEALRNAIRTPRELIETLELDPDRAPLLHGYDDDFPMLVPRSFAARMRRGDPDDPLLRQVLPDERERLNVPGFEADPLQEQRYARDGVVRKYSGRALLIAAGACPVHCRYCFRRNFPYADQLASRQSWSRAVDALRGDTEVTEIILSGGDPLTLTNGAIGELIRTMETVASVQTLRFHTRFPIIIPERVDAGLVDALAATRLRTVVVVHCNHANEIDASVRRALADLKAAGAQLLNQSVLLKGVNDNEDDLAELSKRLFDAGVLPYYLHLLDPVAGAAHFDVAPARGRALVAGLRRRLPGYLVPRLAREAPGESSKTILA
ncbi:MAG: EF-P beta-lysylation protein EpmB [Gammaproteobacteria bacterium]|nr:MAG: EF-P beta-lysylation protein EpmB [Gammaproteobacteria bacterium]